MLKRRGSAVWNGTGAEGQGRLSTFSGALQDQPYSTAMRFQSEDGRAGTNPEELIAAAHAACFNMALSFQLTGAGFPPEELITTAVLTMEQEGVHWSITAVRLELTGNVPGISEEKFQDLVEAAKSGCPVSKALNVDISVAATLAR
ncbi:OsmC family protein [soil metagenome]